MRSPLSLPQAIASSRKSCRSDGGSNNSKKKKKSPTERKSSWRMLYSRFPRIATFAARRIRLRNAPGSAYANPSAHISDIVHSCPHLDYLNYICNAYRDAVGTEYVGFAHALRLRHRRRSRRRRRHRCGRTMYAYVCSSVNARPYVLTCFQRTHANAPTRGFTCVRSRRRACRCSLRTGTPVLSDSSFACAWGLHTHVRTRTQVRACYNTLRPVIALHISVISAALSLPPVNHGALQ